jgi:hypothetical protein
MCPATDFSQRDTKNLELFWSQTAPVLLSLWFKGKGCVCHLPSPLTLCRWNGCPWKTQFIAELSEWVECDCHSRARGGSWAEPVGDMLDHWGVDAFWGGKRLIRKWKIPTVKAGEAEYGYRYLWAVSFPFIYWTQVEGAGELLIDVRVKTGKLFKS